MPAHRFRLKLPGVPVFNYHGLAASFSPEVAPAVQRFWLSPAQFRSHLAHIRHAGFRVALLEELKDRPPGLAGKIPVTVLTFDDGLASDYEFGFALLAEFGMRGTFFVNTSTVGQSGYLTWSQLAEMQSAGMSIQSHSHRHVDLTVLPELALRDELSQSRRCLQDRLGSPVEFLAAPHGLLNRRVVRSALAAGYRAVCSARCWPANPASRVFTRISLHRSTGLEEFHGFLTGEPSPYAARLFRGLLYRPGGIASHLLGILRYRWLKQAAPVSE